MFKSTRLLNQLNLHVMLVFLLFFFLTSASAYEGKNSNVIPKQLHDWIPWVTKDNPKFGCPTLINLSHKICAYPEALSLNINRQSGSFNQAWTVYNKDWIPLPGDGSNWPLKIQINNESHSVVERNGLPFVVLEAGHYNIQGIFKWNNQPKRMAVPVQTGLLRLTVNEQPIKVPDFRNGKLWFKSSESKIHKNNRLQVQVFRKFTDSIPAQVQTYIRMDVSGKQREIILDGAQLKGFIPSSLHSRLPVQMDQQGRLKIQVRPGIWSVDIAGRYPEQITSLHLPDYATPWPKQEIWVLELMPHLRQINVIDKRSIDANQTQLPKKWKKHPTYQMKSGETLSFDVIKRGDPDSEPDQLNLSKKIWLDFDGKGFTINDTITGKLSRQWRLNAANDVQLGQVTVNSQPQYITYNKDKTLRGVEVRHGNLNLSADSRIEGESTFSSGGWDVDFNSVSAKLYLPAGWKLFALSGAKTSSTWIASWSLLDLFIVLITAIAMYKLWGILWGVLGLISLVLIWHQAIAPQFIWINLIVAIALLKVLPESRFIKFVRSYRLMMSVILVLIVLPFIVDQARTAVYPQLEFNNRNAAQDSYSVSMRDDLETVELASEGASRMVSKSLSNYAPQKESKKQIQRDMNMIDPDAMIQTGPGLPSWTLRTHHIHWDGPVKENQSISMILMSPAVNSLLNVLRILLVILMAWRLIGYTSLKLPSVSNFKTAKALLPFLLLTSMITGSPSVEAAYPSQELLSELRKTLNKKEECQPQCTIIESMSVNLKDDNLSLNLRVLAQTDHSIPLPVPLKKWMPNRIQVNEQDASLVFRHNNQLWLHLTKGNHQVTISGSIDYLNHLQLQFPLKPHYIELNVSGWSSEGWDNDIKKINALSFSRVEENNQSITLEQSEIPVHVEIKRTLNFSVDWQVTTQVRVLAGTSFPEVVNIPLLSGESVLSDGVKVKDGHVVVTLSQQQKVISWNSKLAITDKLDLTAIDSKQAIEQWELNVGSMWSVTYKGIPVIYHQRSGSTWQPQWRPWPTEQVSLTIRRPEGVKGKTVTIDSSKLQFKPGEQITVAILDFSLRSSLGGQHIVKLPEQAELQKVVINGKALPVRQTEQGIPLPINPGQQKIQITWQQPAGVKAIYKAPIVNLGIESVNNSVSLEPGYNRWVLLTNGPEMGPAVLFWGIFGVILIISYGLGRIKGLPLNTMHWLLLWIGLSASLPATMVLIAGTIILLGKRQTMNTGQLTNATFNLMQIGLIALMVLSVLLLIVSIQQGLLGSPQMQITGNGSSSYLLNWFSDRIGTQTPPVTMWSVPVYIYRVMMLLWSIWLAFAFIKWVKWAWQAFTHGEGWRHIEPKRKKVRSKQELTVDENDIDFMKKK